MKLWKNYREKIFWKVFQKKAIFTSRTILGFRRHKIISRWHVYLEAARKRGFMEFCLAVVWVYANFFPDKHFVKLSCVVMQWLELLVGCKLQSEANNCSCLLMHHRISKLDILKLKKENFLHSHQWAEGVRNFFCAI